MSYRLKETACFPCQLLLPLAYALNAAHYRTDNTFKLIALACFSTSLVTFLWTKHKLYGRRSRIYVSAGFSAFFAFATRWADLADSASLAAFVGLITGYILMLVLKRFTTLFPGSFTVCEMIIVIQSAMPYLSVSFGCVLSRYVRAKHESYCYDEKSASVLQMLFLGMAAIVTTISMMRESRSQLKLVAILAFDVLITYFGLFQVVHMEPINWLVAYIFQSETKARQLLTWTAILAVSMGFAAVWASVSKRNASTIVRKFFHLVIVTVFVFGASSLDFLSFSTACLLLVFILLEVIRFSRLQPVARVIDNCFERFRDDKDRGYLTLTHIYLLVGCALPLWMSPAKTDLNVFSGLIAIGFGDTAASVVGSLLGRWKWPGSSRTYEGTAAAIIAQTMATIWLWRLFVPYQIISYLHVTVIFVISSIVAYVEATTNQVDNLLLPLYHYVLMLSAKFLLPTL